MGQLVSDVTEILDYKDAKSAAKSTRNKILADMAADEQTKTNLVKKTLAAQRAKYGAAGMTNRGMTEGAVLARLKSETSAPYEEKRKANMDKLKSVRVKKPNLVKTLLDRFEDLIA